MESSKPAQNIQDSFLNTARKERLNITIYLLSGVKLTGRIRSFDKYSVVLEANGQEQLIFKHAISTVVIGRTAGHGAHLAHPEAKATAVPASAGTSSTGTGSAETAKSGSAAPAAASGTAASPAASAASASGTEG